MADATSEKSSVKSVVEMYMSRRNIEDNIMDTVRGFASESLIKIFLKKFQLDQHFKDLLVKYQGTKMDENQLLVAVLSETRYYLKKVPVMLNIVFNHFDIDEFCNKLAIDITSFDSEEGDLERKSRVRTTKMDDDERQLLIHQMLTEYLASYKCSTEFEREADELAKQRRTTNAATEQKTTDGQRSADITFDGDDVDSQRSDKTWTDAANEILKKAEVQYLEKCKMRVALEAGQRSQQKAREEREAHDAKDRLINLKKEKAVVEAALVFLESVKSCFAGVVTAIDTVLATKFKHINVKAQLNCEVTFKDASGNEYTYRNSLTEPNLYGLYGILYSRYSTNDFSRTLPEVISLFNHTFDSNKLSKDPRILMQWVSEFRTMWQTTSFMENFTEEIFSGILMVHSIPDNCELKKRVLTKILECMQENKPIISTIQQFIDIEYSSVSNTTSNKAANRTAQLNTPKIQPYDGTQLAHFTDTSNNGVIPDGVLYDEVILKNRNLKVKSPRGDKIWPYVAALNKIDVCASCGNDSSPRTSCSNNSNTTYFCYTKKCTNCGYYGHVKEVCHNKPRK